MDEHGNTVEGASTAFEENRKEVIYHLYVEGEKLIQREQWSPHLVYCHMCGSLASWRTKEYQKDYATPVKVDEVERDWCDDCIPGRFVDLWRTWEATPDVDPNDLHSPSDLNETNTGLLAQRDTASVVTSLDDGRGSLVVQGVLDHLELSRDAVTCTSCGDRADWFIGEIVDIFRSYDYGIAWKKTFYCDSCMEDVTSKRPPSEVEPHCNDHRKDGKEGTDGVL